MNFRNAMSWLKGDLIPAVLLAALLVFCIGRAHSLGVHCADDALNTTVAKNLVAGLGYGSTLQTGELRPFDLSITTGPAVILPAALGIAVAGNQPWVPGTALAVVWGTLMVLLYSTLRKSWVGWPAEASRDAAVFFMLSIPLLFPYHFEIWCNLLGEAVAALFLLIACALAGGSLSRRRIFLAGSACALATLSKLIAAPGFVVLLAVLAVRSIFWEKNPWRTSAGLFLACVLGFFVPLLLFEAYKVMSLWDFPQYLEFAGRKASMVQDVGVSKSLLAGAQKYDAAFQARVGISAWQVLITAAAALWVVCHSGMSPVAWSAIATAAQLWILGGYYLFVSSGVPRHFMVGLILWIGLVAMALATLRPRTRLVAGALVLAFLFSGNYAKMRYPVLVMDNGFFQPSEELRGALEIARAVDVQRAASGNRTIYATQSWASAVDVEYYSQSTGVFRSHRLLGDSKDFAVVYNKRFTGLENPEFQKTLAKCGSPEIETKNHVLFRSKLGDD